MGAGHGDLRSEAFRRQDWIQICRRDRGDVVWQHRRDSNLKIISYPIFSQNQKEFNHQKYLYYLRKNNPRLVATLFLQAQQHKDLCSSNYKHQLFLENIPITLSDVQHIPYPDHLHLYEQCLSGFFQLATSVGCFLVQEEYIGITERGVVKVWLNGDFHSSFVVGSRVLEEIMVRSIIDALDKNVDQMLMPPNIPSVKNYLFRNHDALKFQTAIAEFGQFIRTYNGGKVPDRLECIDKVGGIQVIVNREPNTEESKLQQKTLNSQYRPELRTIGNGLVPQSSSISSERSQNRRQMNIIPLEHMYGIRNQESPILNAVRSTGQFRNENLQTNPIQRNPIVMLREQPFPSNYANARMISPPQQPLANGFRSNNLINNIQSSTHIGAAPILFSSNHQIPVQRTFQSPPRFISPQLQVIPNGSHMVGPAIQNSRPLLRTPMPVARSSQIIYQTQHISPHIFNQPQRIYQFQQQPIFGSQKYVKTIPFTVEVIPGKIDKPNAQTINFPIMASKNVKKNNPSNIPKDVSSNNPIIFPTSSTQAYQQLAPVSMNSQDNRVQINSVVNQLNNYQSQQAHILVPANEKQIQSYHEVKEVTSPITLDDAKELQSQQTISQQKLKKGPEGFGRKHSINSNDGRVPSFINERQKLHSQFNTKFQKEKDSPPNNQESVEIGESDRDQAHQFNTDTNNNDAIISQLLQHEKPLSNIQSLAVQSINSAQESEQVQSLQTSDIKDTANQKEIPILMQNETVVEQPDMAGSFNPAYTAFMFQKQNQNQQAPYASSIKNNYENLAYGITADQRDVAYDNQYKYDTFDYKQQYVNANANDGKSSQQFLSKLRSIQQGSNAGLKQISPTTDFGNYGTYYESNYTNSIGEYKQNSYLNGFDPQKYVYGGSSYQTNNYNDQTSNNQHQAYAFNDNYANVYESKQIPSEDQFAQSTISNSLPNSYPTEDFLRSRQPYKFETNIDLTYSKTENLQSNLTQGLPSSYTQTYGLYAQP